MRAVGIGLLVGLVAAEPGCSGSGHVAAFIEAGNRSAALLGGKLLACEDTSVHCAEWAGMGECDKNRAFMRAECKKSCAACEVGNADVHNFVEVALHAARSLALPCSWAALAPKEQSTLAVPEVCDRVAEQLAELLRPPPLDLAAPGLVALGASLRRLAASLSQSAAAMCEACPELHPPLPSGVVNAQPPAGRAPLGESVDLADGVQMPTLGLGTWMMPNGPECVEMVAAGLRAGLRHIDSSENYGNLQSIGAAIGASGVPRADLFLASKLSFDFSYSAEGVRLVVEAHLKQLNTSYLDLMMLHSVGPNPQARDEAWRELELLKRAGVVRAIGVSNFGTHDLASLARVAETRPATLQVKFNPFHQGRTGNAAAEDLAAAALQGGTTVVGYCPLNDWPSKLAPIDDAIVAHVARSYARTPAQVLLRWGLQRGVAVLTRSRSEARLREALGAHTFRLSNADMALLSGLAWLLAAPANRPPGSVLDVLGVAEADEWAREAAAAKEEL